MFSHVHIAGAITWSDEHRLTTYGNVDQAPSITQTSDHRIWIVWQKAIIPGRAIFCRTSSDYGISWSQEKNLTQVPSEDMNQNPSITQLSNGTIMVVWSAARTPPPEPDFDLSADPSSLTIPQDRSNTSTIIVTSTAGFSDPVNLSVKSILPFSPYIHTDLAPRQVTPPPNGNATSTLSIDVGAGTIPDNYIIHVNGRSASLNKTESVNVELTVTAATGSTTSGFSYTVPLNTSESEALQDYEIYYKVSHDNGTSWSRAIRLTDDPADDNGPSVLQASNGTIWVVWSSKRTENYELFYKTSSDMGASWSNYTQLTFDLDADAFPAIAQMNDGRIWVTWHSSRYYNNGGSEIFYKTYDGVSWSSDERLTNTSKDIDDTGPAILQTANGTIWIFWASEGDLQPPFILYKQSYDNGITWSDTFELTAGLSTDKQPAATQTCDLKVWVVWASLRDADFEIYYKTSLVHNVAVTHVVPSEFQVYQEEIVSVNVTVQNYGDYNETTTLTCYVNSTSIGAESVDIHSAASSTSAFTWNTSGFPRGNYLITVNASIVDGEAYVDDNTETYDTVRVKLLGDIDDNAIVDASDLSTLSDAYGSASGNPRWHEESDMNGDDKISILDLFALSKNYGQTE